MLRFYYNLAPNPMKVALLLEELGLPYEAIPVDTRKGEQHDPAFLAVNPNAKLPAIVDGPATIFDSNAILLYLAEKTGRFLPDGGASARGQMLSWLMFVASGVGPFSGQAIHFRHFAPQAAPGDHAYALRRHDFEARRHWRIIDDRLARQRYLLGDGYGIVDMAVWGWGGRVPFIFGGDRGYSEFPHLGRLMAEIDARPAAQRVAALRERHRFKAELDETALRSLYPQIFAPPPA